MLNHRGRCYHLYYIKVADIIAILLFVADGKPQKVYVTAFEDGRCYCQVADGIATAGWVTGYKFWGVEQNLIPNMWQMVFAYVPI